MATNNRQQFELLPIREAVDLPITPDLVARVRTLPTLLRAWNHAWEVTGLEQKEVYMPVGIDGSHWAKIKNNDAGIPADDRFTRFQQRVRNNVLLIWHCESQGFDALSLRKHYSTDADRRVAELEEENAALRRIVSRGRP